VENGFNIDNFSEQTFKNLKELYNPEFTIKLKKRLIIPTPENFQQVKGFAAS
jgi:hypothetical protein